MAVPQHNNNNNHQVNTGNTHRPQSMSCLCLMEGPMHAMRAGLEQRPEPRPEERPGLQKAMRASSMVGIITGWDRAVRQAVRWHGSTADSGVSSLRMDHAAQPPSSPGR